MTKQATVTLFSLLTLASCGEAKESGAASGGDAGRAGAPTESGGQAPSSEGGKSGGAPSSGGAPESAGATSRGGATQGGEVGTGGGGTGGDDGVTRGGAAGAASAGAAGQASAGSGPGGNRCRPELLVLLDRSASMNDPPDGAIASASKWDLVVSALDQALAENEKAVGWGLKVFPEGDGSLCALSVTNAVDVPLVASAATMSAAIHATIPSADGTPTGDAVKAATTYLATRPSDRPRYIVLVTDGEPSCAGSVSSSAEGRTFAIASVAAAAQAGIHTFVVGVSTSKISAMTTLSSMATAGLEPRDPANPVATQYYLTSNVADLTQAFKTISDAAACP